MPGSGSTPSRSTETAASRTGTSWETETTAHILTQENFHGHCFPRGVRRDDRPGEGAFVRLPGRQRHLFPDPHGRAARVRRGRERRHHPGEIGRASCRERGEQLWVDGGAK